MNILLIKSLSREQDLRFVNNVQRHVWFVAVTVKLMQKQLIKLRNLGRSHAMPFFLRFWVKNNRTAQLRQLNNRAMLRNQRSKHFSCLRREWTGAQMEHKLPCVLDILYIYIYCASCCETNRVICMVKIGETLLQLTRGTEYFNHF